LQAAQYVDALLVQIGTARTGLPAQASA
jgi:hypothetical protein